MLSAAANSDPAIESVVVDAGGQQRFLRTSPEFPLKRLLATEPMAIYELGRVFRAGEQGRLHNPEFTMLEWYRPGWDHRQLADEVVALISGSTSNPLQVRRITYRQLFESLGIDAIAGPTVSIVRVAEQHGSPTHLNRQQALDYLQAAVLAPQFSDSDLTVVTEFPAAQAALSRIDPDDPDVCQRFEVYAGSVELANGYHELTDAVEQTARFNADQHQRTQDQQPVHPLDERLLAALHAGLAGCAGVAVGVDRWLMWLGGYDSLDQILNFHWEIA